MLTRLEIEAAVGPLDLPEIGIPEDSVRRTLGQYGGLLQSTLHLNEAVRGVAQSPRHHLLVLEVARPLAESEQGRVDYWREVFTVAGLGHTVTTCEVAIASDYIKNYLKSSR